MRVLGVPGPKGGGVRTWTLLGYKAWALPGPQVGRTSSPLPTPGTRAGEGVKAINRLAEGAGSHSGTPVTWESPPPHLRQVFRGGNSSSSLFVARERKKAQLTLPGAGPLGTPGVAAMEKADRPNGQGQGPPHSPPPPTPRPGVLAAPVQLSISLT